jgi:hypothetical protein
LAAALPPISIPAKRTLDSGTGKGTEHASCVEGVFHQAADGHRAGAAWHRRDCTGDFLNAVEVDVALDAFRGARDSNVEHRGARLHELRGDQTGDTNGRHDDVGLTAYGGEIAATRVGQGRGGVTALPSEQQDLGKTNER